MPLHTAFCFCGYLRLPSILLILSFSYLTSSLSQFISACPLLLETFLTVPPPPPSPRLVILWSVAQLPFGTSFPVCICPPSLQPCSFFFGAGRSCRTYAIPWLLSPVACSSRPWLSLWGVENWPWATENLLMGATDFLHPPRLPWLEHHLAGAESLEEKWSTRAVPALQHYCSEKASIKLNFLFKNILWPH